MQWKGVWTALVTPFTAGGQEIDWAAYRKLLALQKAGGVAGVVPCGTTGESPTLREQEKQRLIQEALDSGLEVLAGTGSNNTAETVEFSRWASEQGVGGILVVTPYYNKPSQTGLLRHFSAVADAVNCDVVLYNVPGRTITSISPATIAELSKHPRIRAIKEASGNLSFFEEILSALRAKGNSKFDLLTGDDPTLLPFLACGGAGVVSVISNLAPRAFVDLCAAAEAGEWAAARAIHERFFPLVRDIFIETNPVPVKFAMAQMGWCLPDVRLPLAPLGEENARILKKTLSEVSI